MTSALTPHQRRIQRRVAMEQEMTAPARAAADELTKMLTAGLSKEDKAKAAKLLKAAGQELLSPLNSALAE